mmetsp:Transcript_17433/g.41363  ORF Transcript_17433/g.41363 Transcript_17433/m.41363 type:complete len:307 (-) Transcript_17433:184-1104(-)
MPNRYVVAMPQLLGVHKFAYALAAFFAIVGGVAGEHDLDSQCALQLSTKAPLRVAIFMTTHWSQAHQKYLPCWGRAVQQIPLLQHSDLILYTSANISSSDIERFHFRNVTVKKYVNEGWQKGAIKAITDAFGEKGYQEKWFEGYDWVIRLNADVLIMDDTWLRKTMENASIDGIFGACMGDQIHTDFFALPPQAVDYKLVDECSNKYGAEKHFTCAIANVLRSKRFTWVEGAEEKVCRMVGARSPIVHAHTLWQCCPDYLAPEAKCSRLSGNPFPDPNVVIKNLLPYGTARSWLLSTSAATFGRGV